jgi:hypothetical protein
MFTIGCGQSLAKRWLARSNSTLGALAVGNLRSRCAERDGGKPSRRGSLMASSPSRSPRSGLAKARRIEPVSE